jgi:hypothetical protein
MKPVFAATCIGSLASAACAALIAAAPSGVALVACVVDGAIKKESIAQIALACSSDVPGVLIALTAKEAAERNPAVLQTPAMEECRRIASTTSMLYARGMLTPGPVVNQP